MCFKFSKSFNSLDSIFTNFAFKVADYLCFSSIRLKYSYYSLISPFFNSNSLYDLAFLLFLIIPSIILYFLSFSFDFSRRAFKTYSLLSFKSYVFTCLFSLIRWFRLYFIDEFWAERKCLISIYFIKKSWFFYYKNYILF